MDVELLYLDGCPNWQSVNNHLFTLQTEFGFNLRRRLVSTANEAVRIGFRGSPTILVNGVDPFASGDEPIGLSCRIYTTSAGPAGSPTEDQLRSAVTR